MKNLIYQYYIPYEAGDADMGGVEMPEWAQAGSRSAQHYAKYVGAEYMLRHDRYFSIWILDSIQFESCMTSNSTSMIGFLHWIWICWSVRLKIYLTLCQNVM